MQRSESTSCSIEVKKSDDVFIKICIDGDILRKMSSSKYHLLEDNQTIQSYMHTGEDV